MNKYEERADRDRKSTLRSSLLLGMAGIVLVLLILFFLGRSNSVPSSFWSKVGIVVAVLLLILRQMQRQLRRRGYGNG
jgi:FtsH-binding integral membrane protein